MSEETIKETPTQRVERVKRERAPWSIMDDIRRYATLGLDSVPDEDLNIRFRHWGIYTQGDGLGVRGNAVPYFMMRIRTPNGILTSEQVRTVARISSQYARNSVDITNRQNFQLHWLRLEELPIIWDTLSAVGLMSQGACGDNTRTVTGCPLAGVTHNELIDASPLVQQIDRHFNGNPAYQNLPRKYKITITGCDAWCTYPEINDVGLTAVRRGTEIGFSVRVGGGLSTRPHLARKLDAFVRYDQVLDVVAAITALFRDSDELRTNRAKARLKFLFLNHGWTDESFLAEVTRRLGYTLDPAVEDTPPSDVYRDHVGLHRQREPGLYYAGFSIPSGRTSPDELHRIADLADTYGRGRLRNTAMQNIIMLDIPESRLTPFTQDAAATGLALDSTLFQRGLLSCTGSQYCKLAVVETKQFSLDLARQLDKALVPQLLNTDSAVLLPASGVRTSHENTFTAPGGLRVHVTGCPNACGQHYIAGIGLQGVQVPTEAGGTTDGFDFFIGGGLGQAARFARRIGYRTHAGDVARALQHLVLGYVDDRDESETFTQWVTRVGDAHVKTLLAAPLVNGP